MIGNPAIASTWEKLILSDCRGENIGFWKPIIRKEQINFHDE
jgi:hypothetical protein